MLEEAACELFLERGYAETSVADITRRAGVSRATFFNYVDSKSGLLWASIDDVIEEIDRTLGGASAAPGEIRAALLEAGSGVAPGVAVLAIANSDAMGMGDELLLTGAGRQARLARILADALRGGGLDPLEADVTARAHAGAFFAALESWAMADPGVQEFAAELERALGLVG